jgi:CubicO group peptidase (beta-lactamase class C family)
MMKFALVAIQKGKWKGEQLISKVYMENATSRIVKTGDDDIFGGGKDVSNSGYGYFWWKTDLHNKGKDYQAVSSQGGGGIYTFLIEELDLTIVVTAHHRGEQTQQLVAEKIIPAFL